MHKREGTWKEKKVPLKEYAGQDVWMKPEDEKM
jgi:hypothetical protein